MPQEFHVLRCYSCETFQVHIVKKSNKWACKMCGEKQSVKKVYGKGDSRDCRVHVQSLNATRCVDECVEPEMPISEDTRNINEDSQSCHLSSNNSSAGSSKKSKWDEYVVEENAAVHDVSDEDSKYTFERQKKRNRPQKKYAVESGREHKRFKQ